MKGYFVLAGLILSPIFFMSSSYAQKVYTPKPPAQVVSTTASASSVDEKELENAILKILAAAPKDFGPVRGDLIDTGKYKGRYDGRISMSSTKSKSFISEKNDYYVLAVLRDVDKSILSPSAVLAMGVIKRAMGDGTVENKEESQFGTINYRYRNSNRNEWVELAIHPYGHLTLFIYKK